MVMLHKGFVWQCYKNVVLNKHQLNVIWIHK